MERNLLKILVIAGLLLSSTSCKKNVYSVKVYGLKSCGNCRILIDDFKDDDNIQLHMIDIDTHILAYKKDIALYVSARYFARNGSPGIKTVFAISPFFASLCGVAIIRSPFIIIF